MTVKEIVKAYLEEHGFDGLINRDAECGCDCSDLIQCAGNFDCRDCEPGYKIPCPGDDCEFGGGCEWHITIVRPEAMP